MLSCVILLNFPCLKYDIRGISTQLHDINAMDITIMFPVCEFLLKVLLKYQIPGFACRTQEDLFLVGIVIPDAKLNPLVCRFVHLLPSCN